jgi:hypothetical protein
MNKLIISGIIGLMIEISGLQPTWAQGTLYVSSLGLASSGGLSVGGDSWGAAEVYTGTNAGGYLLNSIQLALGDATGNPADFTAMIYGGGNWPASSYLGSNICTLSGSLTPVSADTYTYSPTSDLVLSQRNTYFIVLTDGTPAIDGAFEWTVTSTYAPTLEGGWGGARFLFSSSNGFDWNGGPRAQ